MALIAAEGFDVYGYNIVNWPMDTRWSGYYSSKCYISSSGRFSRPCLYVGYVTGNTPKPIFNLEAEYTTLHTGFAFKIGNLGTEDIVHAFRYTTNDQLQLLITTTGAIQAKTAGGASVGQTADFIITAGVWHYWEIKVVCDASSGSVVIKIDGTDVLNVTGVNTQGYGSNGITQLYWLCNHSGAVNYLDDFIVFDTTGATFNDFLGDLAVIGHVPEADGTDTDWTSTKASQYDAVDDLGSSYNTDYIESSGEGHQDCWTITPSGTYPSILGVEVAGHGFNSGGGTAKVTPYVRIGGVVYYGDELTLSAGTTDKVAYTWKTNPATAALWSKADVAAAEFGFEVTEIT